MRPERGTMKQTGKVFPVQRQLKVSKAMTDSNVLDDVDDVSMGTLETDDELDVTIPLFGNYYNSIIADDYESVGQFLSLSDDTERQRLMNRPFKYPIIKVGNADVTDDDWYFEVKYPVLLAGVVGSLGVLGVFLDNGADFTVCGSGQCNVLHALCAEGYIFPEKEQNLVDTYNLLLERLPIDTIKQLMMQESRFGLRPIECASFLSCFHLAEAMWETREIYLMKIQTVNATTYKWYDVTDYEHIDVIMEKRGCMSPLVQIQSMTVEKLSNPHAKRMINPRDGLFGEWLSYKKRCYNLPLALWGLFRLLHIMLFLIYESDIKWVKQVGGMPQTVYDATLWNITRNMSPEPFPICDNFVLTDIPYGALRVMRFVLTGIAAFSFLKELFDYLRIMVMLKQWDSPMCQDADELKRTLPSIQRPTALQYPIYALADILSPIFITIIVNVLPLMTSREGVYATLVEICRILTALSLLYTTFFLIQLVPFIGPFVITANRLVSDLMKFLIILLMFLLPSSVYMLIMINLKSDQGCIEEFSSFSRALYSTFLVAVQIFDVSRYNLVSAGTFYFLHTFIVLYIGILLMNFLIGILSHSIAEMNENMDVICAVQQANVITILEYRFFLLIKPYLKRIQKNIFPSAGDRLYVVVKSHPNDTRQRLQNWQAENCPIR